MLSLATNPIPIKAALAMLDMCADEVRLPLVTMPNSKIEQLKNTLADYGLLT